MNNLLHTSSASYANRSGNGKRLHLWGNQADPLPFANHIGGQDFLSLMREVDLLMEKGYPLGMAFIFGEVDPVICRQIRDAAARQSDYVSWVSTGPVLIVVFRKALFADLNKAWRRIVADNIVVSAGVVFSDSLKDHTEFLLAAGIALHRAMAEHQDTLVLDANETIKAVADHRMAVLMKKHLAAGGGDFEAYFQPQVAIGSACPSGAEALARWHPDEEEVPPSRFIPIAEEAGLIGEIGQMMFALSARAIRVLRNSGIEIPHIAVNVSPIQSRNGDLLRMVLDILHAEKLRPSDIEIEITESLVGSGGDDFMRWLADLSAAGFQIAIDDFGTGTSTLAHLREFPADKIKLDRAFVTPLPDDVAACAVCRTALDMVHALGKKSLAEGIENSYQATYLGSLDCALGQGYFWGRPMTENNLIAWWGRQT